MQTLEQSFDVEHTALFPLYMSPVQYVYSNISNVRRHR